jgi:subtilisin family serine protease
MRPQPRLRAAVWLAAIVAVVLAGCSKTTVELSVTPGARTADLGGTPAFFTLRNDATEGAPVTWTFESATLQAVPGSGTLAPSATQFVSVTAKALTVSGGSGNTGAFVSGRTRVRISVTFACDVPALLPSASAPTDQILVGYRRDALATAAARSDVATAALQVAAAAGGALLRTGSGSEHDLIRVPLDHLDQALAALRARPEVAYAALNVPLELHGAPSDPLYPLQWNLSSFGAEAAWASAEAATTPERPIVIAVVDDGIAVDHPDLVGVVLPGWDAYHGDTDVRNCSDHGTHVAGIASATRGDEGVAGVASVGWARLLPVKAWPDTLTGEGGRLDTVLRGMRWAGGLPVNGAPTNPHTADVINLSLGTASTDSGTTDAFRTVIDELETAGVVVVSAAGNAGAATVDLPARAGGIAVGSVDCAYQRSNFSNYGSALTLMAPGGSGGNTGCNGDREIIGAGLVSDNGSFDHAWVTKAGTSMATPYVAGAVALLIGVEPTLRGDPAGIKARLVDTASQLRPLGYSADRYGAGVLCLDALLTTTSVCGVSTTGP